MILIFLQHFPAFCDGGKRPDQILTQRARCSTRITKKIAKNLTDFTIFFFSCMMVFKKTPPLPGSCTEVILSKQSKNRYNTLKRNWNKQQKKSVHAKFSASNNTTVISEVEFPILMQNKIQSHSWILTPAKHSSPNCRPCCLWQVQ